MTGNDKNLPLPGREFGRVASRPDIHDGRPHLRKKFGTVEVFCILDLIRQGVPDAEICTRYAGMDRDDIDSCRAYEARFLTAAANDNSPNVFMLDENSSYLILHEVIRLFGKSSHVMADGLQHTDDEQDIWAHMIENKYQAILTSDRDFKDISRRYRQTLIAQHGNLQDSGKHVPAVVYAHKHISREELRTVIEKNRDEIRRYLEDNDSAVLSISENGAIRQFPDQGVTRKTCPSSPPSQNPAP